MLLTYRKLLQSKAIAIENTIGRKSPRRKNVLMCPRGFKKWLLYQLSYLRPRRTS